MTTKNREARWAYSDRTASETPKLTDEIVRATSHATPGLADLAEGVGVSRDALSSWRQGRRTPTRASVATLAEELASRAKVLESYANTLKRVAADDWSHALALLPLSVHEDLRRIKLPALDLQRGGDGEKAGAFRYLFGQWSDWWRERNGDASVLEIHEAVKGWLRGRAEDVVASSTGIAIHVDDDSLFGITFEFDTGGGAVRSRRYYADGSTGIVAQVPLYKDWLQSTSPEPRLQDGKIVISDDTACYLHLDALWVIAPSVADSPVLEEFRSGLQAQGARDSQIARWISNWWTKNEPPDH